MSYKVGDKICVIVKDRSGARCTEFVEGIRSAARLLGFDIT